MTTNDFPDRQMVQLRLSVEIVEFDLTHATVKLSVLDKRNREPADGSNKKLYQPTATNLKMTLPELHIFLRALMEFKGPLEVTTPDMNRVREPGDDHDEFGGASFLSDQALYRTTEAAE